MRVLGLQGGSVFPPPEQQLHPVLDQQAGNGLSRLKTQGCVPSRWRQDGAAAGLGCPLLSSASTRPAGFPGHTLALKTSRVLI